MRTAITAPPTYVPPPSALPLATLLQKELKRIGCLRGQVDGIWGAGSRAALANFLNRAGLNHLNSYNPTQDALNATYQKGPGFCPPVYVAPQRPNTVTKQVRCSKVKYAFTRGNTCACSGGRIFTGSACVIPQQPRPQQTQAQCVKRCEAIGSQCHRKLTQLGDAQGWDGDLRQDYWDDNCAPKVNACKVACNPKGPMRPGECRYMADGEQVCS